MIDEHTQHPDKVNVFFGNLTRERYFAFLRNLIPALANIFPNAYNLNLSNGRIWLQQDALPHYACDVR